MSNFGKPYLRRTADPLPGVSAVPGISGYNPAASRLPDGATLNTGPHAPVDVFPQLDPQGYQTKEVLSTVVNNMLIGKLNCVNQLAMPLADIAPGTSHFTVFDVRVSPYSLIVLQPESDSAGFFMLTEIGKGYFNLGFNQFLLGQIQARGSIRYDSAIDGDLVIPQDPAAFVIPFSAAGTPAAELVTLSFPTMTLQMAGYYELNIRIDGTYTQNETYNFIFTVGGVEVARISYVLAGTTTSINDTLLFFLDLDEGTVLGLSISQDGGGTGAGTGLVEFRAIRQGNSPLYTDNIPPGNLNDVLMKYAVIG